MMKEVGIIGGLVGVQCVYGVMTMLLNQLMSLQFDPLTIVVFCTFAAFLILTPLSLLLERKLWPRSLSLKLVTKLVLLAVTGVTLFQSMYLEGMKHTSASMATAMPNLCPAFIFIIAWCFGMEKVKLSCVYSRVKIGGTVLCVMGAFVMSLMHSTSSSSSSSSPTFDKDKVFGCILLLVGVLVLSSNLVLQASILREFPAPMSLFSVVSFIGTISTAAVVLIQHGNLNIGGSATGLGTLIGCALLGGIVSGGSLSFNGWVIKKKGPVLVSMFSPIATVVCVLVSSLCLGEPFSVGSFVGMGLMFGGLYFVLWAKGP
ncbi:PREDICTED: WAT1-related protein At4g16620 [Tarenaya hassleriana]|uniref:WAT1-related protein At4g16620 n=1 Tax=Tarenaya hassleriana TaxID=28532 RepID=UPI00053C2C14|nr:PREDICTED: WAT1-related protein At4g16620 [Tarenaya hassleriana]